MRLAHELGASGAKIAGEKSTTSSMASTDQLAVSNFDPPIIATTNYLIDKPHTILIDDFHFWRDRNAIAAVLQPLKEVLGRGSRIVLISVRDAAFSRVEDLENMEGRFHEVRMPQWGRDELEEIARKGFAALNVVLAQSTLSRLRRLCYLNPLLMQGLCIAVCEREGIERTLPETRHLDLSDAQVEEIAGQYAGQETGRFERLAPPTEARSWVAKDNRKLTLSEVVILGINHIEPLKPYPIDVMLKRLQDRILRDALPVTMKATLVQRLQLFEEKTGGEDGGPAPILYDEREQSVVLLDPYFKLWARWNKGPALAGKLLDR